MPKIQPMKGMLTAYLLVVVVAVSSCTTSSTVAPAAPVNQEGPIAQAIAQLQLATPQPLLAPPPIGTPTPVFSANMFSAEEEAYFEVFLPLREKILEAGDALSVQQLAMDKGVTLAEDGTLLHDAEWVHLTAIAIFTLQESNARLRDIVAPPRLTAIHEDMLSFANLYDQSMALLIEGLDNIDLDKLRAADEAMIAGVKHFNNATAQLEALTELATEATPNEQSALCVWFAETQLLRATRISSMTKILSFFQKYESADPVVDDPSIRNELIEALEEFLPYGREFIEKWQQLGSFPEANEFWSKELLGNKQRVAALEKMVQGLKAEDYEMYLTGTEEFVQSNMTTREAESAMLVVLDKCTEQVK